MQRNKSQYSVINTRFCLALFLKILLQMYNVWFFLVFKKVGKGRGRIKDLS